jgi:hypothetical protein
MRLVLVAGIVALCAAARWAHARRQARLAADVAPVPRVPSTFLADGAASWLVFTTPYCASCGPVADMLRDADDGAGVVTVDATVHTDLADAFRIRRSPTVLRADHAGIVDLRLVGPEAVRQYLSAN